MRPPEQPEQEFSIEEAQRRSARRLAGGAILALILLALVRPGYRWIKEARSRTLARRAETALSQGDLTNAAHWAQSAYLTRPSEPAALRAAARVQGTLGHPNALEFWQGLIATGRASSDDRREYVQFAVRVHALDRARAELQALVHEAPSDPRNLWLLGRICFAEGRLDEAVEFVRQALRQDAGNKTYRLFLATLEYDSPDRSSQAEARQTLAELAADPTSLGLEALTFLARQPDLPPDQRRPLVEGLERNPASGTAHRLLALDLKIRSAADQRAGLIEAALRQYAGSGDENVALFGSWLNDHREFGVTLRLLPPETAGKNREQFLLLLDALGGLDRWKEAQDLLARPDLPIPEAFAEAFRARTARKLNDPAGSTAAWKRAFQSLSENSG